MKFTLVSGSNQRVDNFRNAVAVATEGLNVVLTKHVNLQFQPEQSQETETDTQRIRNYCQELQSILERKNESSRALSLYIDWAPSHPNKARLRVLGQLLETLQQLCGQDIKLNVDGNLSYYGRNHRSNFSTPFITTDMEIFSPALESDLTVPFCEDRDVTLSSSTNFLSYSSTWDHVNVTVNIRLIIEDEYIPIYGGDSDKLALICKAIQEQNIHSDISIVAANGSVLSANKCFLAAHSPVLKVSLGNNFAESMNNKIEMPDVSKECVESLIGYFYTMDIPEAVKCASLAVELYQVAHKYEVKALEEKITVMLLLKSNSWYDVDAAVELLQFVTRIEASSGADMKKMKAKVLQVLKSKWEQLKTSESFKKLFEEDPNTAMELCAMAMALAK